MKISEMKIIRRETKIRKNHWDKSVYFIIDFIGEHNMIGKYASGVEQCWETCDSNWEYYKEESLVLKMTVKEIMNDYLWRWKDGTFWGRINFYNPFDEDFLFDVTSRAYNKKELAEQYDYKKIEEL